MPVIILDDATYTKFRELRNSIISSDVLTCREKDNEGTIAVFWSDERVVEFLLDTVGNRLVDRKFNLCLNSSQELSEGCKESLR